MKEKKENQEKRTRTRAGTKGRNRHTDNEGMFRDFSCSHLTNFVTQQYLKPKSKGW